MVAIALVHATLNNVHATSFGLLLMCIMCARNCLIICTYCIDAYHNCLYILCTEYPWSGQHRTSQRLHFLRCLLFNIGYLFKGIPFRHHKANKKKLLYWRNPPDPKNTPDPTLFFFSVKNKTKNQPTDPKK